VTARTTAFRRLAAANPVPDGAVAAFVEHTWRDEMLAAITREPVRKRADRTATARRTLVLALAVVVLGAVPTFAVGRGIVGWLGGEPAPREIVTNLESYTPQLGFDPEPEKTVLVASDGPVHLYVTSNRQGTYCFVVSTRLDGGTCMPASIANAPIVAGFVGGDGEHRTKGLVVIGRVRDPRAQSVRFDAPDGTRVVRNIGLGGFFVAVAPAESPIAACDDRGWSPTFSFYGPLGDEIASATIEIAKPFGSGARRGCAFAGLRAPDDR
jgi:hypothetical protein